MDVEQYRELLTSLLPPGPAWDGKFPLITGAADHLAAVHQQADALAFVETDPKQTVHLLPRYESISGLPDSCSIDGTQTIRERQQRLDAKINTAGGINEEFYLQQLAALGYPDATITRYYNSTFRVGSHVGDRIYSHQWRFVWEVNMPAGSSVKSMTAGSVCGSHLRVWGDSTAQCVIEKLAPSHTIVLFKYPETTYAQN